MLNCPLSKKGSYICIESEWRLTRVQCAQYTHHTIKYNPPIYSHTLKYSTLECKMTFSNRWDFHSLVSGIVVSFSKLKCNCSEPSAAFFCSSRRRFMTSVNRRNNGVSFYCGSIWWWSDTYEPHTHRFLPNNGNATANSLGFSKQKGEWGWGDDVYFYCRILSRILVTLTTHFHIFHRLFFFTNANKSLDIWNGGFEIWFRLKIWNCLVWSGS